MHARRPNSNLIGPESSGVSGDDRLLHSMIDYSGWIVYGADRTTVGSIEGSVRSTCEGQAQYFIVDLEASHERVLVPVAYTRVNLARRRINLRALPARGCSVLPSYTGGPLTEELEDFVWWVFVTAEEAAEEGTRARRGGSRARTSTS